MIFAANELPRVYDFSVGFWSRWVLLEFPYKFVDENELKNADVKEKEVFRLRDEVIIDKISTQEELNGLLIMALEGLDKLKQKKDFSYSKGTAEVKEQWIRKSDSFTAFCMDEIVETIDSHIPKDQIRRKFHQYCKRLKLKSIGDKSIKVTLESMFGAIETKIGPYQEQIRVWEGICFKSDQNPEKDEKLEENDGRIDVKVEKVY